jgi:hypothetical protein
MLREIFSEAITIENKSISALQKFFMQTASLGTLIKAALDFFRRELNTMILNSLLVAIYLAINMS